MNKKGKEKIKKKTSKRCDIVVRKFALQKIKQKKEKS